jgi:hypothetical protein
LFLRFYPQVDEISSEEQIVRWSRRSMKQRVRVRAAEEVVSGVDSESPSPPPSTLLALFYRNDQMLAQMRMVWEFCARPLCSSVLPYLMVDAHAVVSGTHALPRLLRFLWQVPASVAAAYPLPTTLEASRAMQANLSRLDGQAVIHLARTWAHSYTNSDSTFFWATGISNLHSLSSILEWALARGGTRLLGEDQRLFHWLGGTLVLRACKRLPSFPPFTPQDMLLGCSSSPG